MSKAESTETSDRTLVCRASGTRQVREWSTRGCGVQYAQITNFHICGPDAGGSTSSIPTLVHDGVVAASAAEVMSLRVYHVAKFTHTKSIRRMHAGSSFLCLLVSIHVHLNFYVDISKKIWLSQTLGFRNKIWLSQTLGFRNRIVSMRQSYCETSVYDETILWCYPR